jgi:hypothetical protein
MKKILFFNKFHIGDHLFCKSFIKQFCEINKNIDISLLINYNSFLFSDIPNLNIIISSINKNYNNNLIINDIDPLNISNINNNDFIYHSTIINNFNETIHYIINNDTIYINLWIGTARNIQNLSTDNIEANVIECNKYYNFIINFINNNYNLNINLIKNIDEFPIIPYTNIDNFLNFKLNKKIIFYYNYKPKSGQSFDNINHEENIKYLSNKYKDHIICCAIKPTYYNNNIISIDNFDYKIDITCENVAKSYYCALNSNIIFIFDVGACWYYLNDEFQEKFKGIAFHITNFTNYYNKLNNNYKNTSKKNKIILLNSLKLYSINI